VIALAKSAKSGVHQLAPHILVAKKNFIPKVDDSDLVIALPHSRVPAANGAIVVAADGDVRAHIGGGNTVVIGGDDTKLTTSHRATQLPPGTQVYRHGIKDEKVSEFRIRCTT
jgi:hypothetical protein